MSLFLLCACSKDNDGIDNTPSIEVGVHKIELSLDGDWKNFNCEFGFVGVRPMSHATTAARRTAAYITLRIRATRWKPGPMMDASTSLVRSSSITLTARRAR